MIKELYNVVKITGANNHLLDIFSPNAYLEIGNVDYHIFSRLLNYEEITLEELTSFSIQNIGLWQSDIENEQLKNIIPYLFFENINHKNNSIQLFLTYGVIRLIDDSMKEMFIPMVLVPITIYLNSTNITFQMSSKPIVNQSLVDLILKKYNISITFFKLDSVSLIDKYIMQFEDVPSSIISLENYITYGYMKTINLRIPHKKFSFKKESIPNIEDLDLEMKNNLFKTYTLLNKEQRQAYLNAKKGNSFAISGRLGTGKTSTLINIAIDKMVNGEKVLYISNMHETLEDVKKYMEEHGLESYVCDLTVPFNRLPKIITNNCRKDNLDIQTKIKEVISDYQKVHNYESELFGRICDYRYIEVVEELLKLEVKEKTYLRIDDLSPIYKHEFINIIKSVATLQSLLDEFSSKNILCINQSHFYEIPITIDLDTANKKFIMKIIQNIRNEFTQLKYFKGYFESNYGMSEINNFGKIRLIRTYFEGLDKDIVPLQWRSINSKIYKEASRKYLKLEDDIKRYNDLLSKVNDNYNNYESLNINDEIKVVLGEYFTIDEGAKIDRINKNRVSLTKLINRGAIERETFLKSLNKIKKFMNCTFDDDIKTMEELARLATFLGTTKINPIWLNYLDNEKLKNVIKKIDVCKDVINQYNDLVTDFSMYFSKYTIDDLDSIISLLSNLEDNPSLIKKKEYYFFKVLKKKFNLSNFDDLLNDLKKLSKLQNVIESYKARYLKLVGKPYFSDDDAIYNINKVVNYIKSIKDPNLKKVFINYILKRSQNNLTVDVTDNQFVAFNLFLKSYNNIINIHNTLSTYYPVSNHGKVTELLDNILNCFSYFKRIFNSNDRIKVVINNYKGDYILFNTYLIIKEDLERLQQTIDYLNNNDEYKRLYGDYYVGVNTNCHELSRFIDYYKGYLNIFKSFDSVINSFNEVTRKDILKYLEVIKGLSNQLGLHITQYNTIFKRASDISYYNSTFDEVLAYLDKLIIHDDELDIYLNSISHLQVLLKSKLNKLVGYILKTNNIKNLESSVKYVYFKTLNDLYLSDKQYIINSEELKENLRSLALKLIELNDMNNELAGYNLRRNSASKVNTKAKTYDEFIYKSCILKKLYLSNTTILNNYISISNFDLVIVDDVQVGNVNEYSVALRANQVICAGIYQKQTIFALDLLSRMRSNNVVDFYYRYIPTPKQLITQMGTQNCIIRPTYSQNYGIELVTTSIIEYLVNLLSNNNNYKINVFSQSLEIQKFIYVELSKAFLKKEFSIETIIHFFTNNINITDLNNQYLIDSDYNIIVLKDYVDNKYDNISSNLLDFLLQTRKKLIIYDDENYLSKDKQSILVSNLRKVLQSNNDIFEQDFSNQLVINIANYFNSKSIKTFSHYNDFTLLLEYNDKLYGLVLIWNKEVSTYYTIDMYLKSSEVNRKQGLRVFNVLLYDLNQNYEKVLQEIVGEIKDE